MRSCTRPVRSAAGQPIAFTAGSYLTDGRRLFRVVTQFGSDAPHAELEDCLTLDVDVYDRQLTRWAAARVAPPAG